MTVADQMAEMFGESMSPDHIAADADTVVDTFIEPRGRWAHTAVPSTGNIERVNDRESVLDDRRIGGTLLVVTVFNKEELGEFVRVEPEQLFDRTPINTESFPLTMLKAAVVRPEYRGMGYGRKLMEAGMDAAGHLPFLGMGWNRAGMSTSDQSHLVLYDHMMTRHARFEDATPDGFRCTHCGYDATCNCGSIAYTRRHSEK